MFSRFLILYRLYISYHPVFYLPTNKLKTKQLKPTTILIDISVYISFNINMPKVTRVVVANYPHHVIQQYICFIGGDGMNEEIRKATATGRPSGSMSFIEMFKALG